jgi:hypothetical protein
MSTRFPRSRLAPQYQHSPLHFGHAAPIARLECWHYARQAVSTIIGKFVIVPAIFTIFEPVIEFFF